MVDDNCTISSLSNEEIAKRGKQGTSVCIKYPGICAHYFKLAVDVIIREVIGWDLKNK